MLGPSLRIQKNWESPPPGPLIYIVLLTSDVLVALEVSEELTIFSVCLVWLNKLFFWLEAYTDSVNWNTWNDRFLYVNQSFFGYMH